MHVVGAIALKIWISLFLKSLLKQQCIFLSRVNLLFSVPTNDKNRVAQVPPGYPRELCLAAGPSPSLDIFARKTDTGGTK